MSTRRDFDRTSKAWLAEGPTELADRVLDAALHEVHSTHQRRLLWGLPWRTSPMLNRFRLAAVAVVAVIAVGVVALNLPRLPGVGGPGTSPSPSAAGGTVVDTADGLGDFAIPLKITLPTGWTLPHGFLNAIVLINDGTTPPKSTPWGPDIVVVDGGWVRDPASVPASAPETFQAARIPFPADFFGYLRGLAGLTVVQEASPVTIGGIAGSRIVVKTPAIHPLIWLAGDTTWLPLRSEATTTTSYMLLAVQGKSMLVIETDPDAVFADRDAQIQAILQTIVFGS